jgi:hypothetical protein
MCRCSDDSGTNHRNTEVTLALRPVLFWQIFRRFRPGQVPERLANKDFLPTEAELRYIPYIRSTTELKVAKLPQPRISDHGPSGAFTAKIAYYLYVCTVHTSTTTDCTTVQ